MDKNLKHDPDYAIEEQDDPRTADAYSEGGSHDEMSHGTSHVEIPDRATQKRAVSVGEILDYWSELKTLIDACGQASYYWHMWKGLSEGVPKMRIVSDSYKRTAKYYEEHYREWNYKARMSLARFRIKAAPHFKVCVGIPDKEFLNKLTLEKGRRDAYKCYIATYMKKRKLKPVVILEEKYQKRLEKRASPKK